IADHLTLGNSRSATRRPSSVFNEAGVGVLSRSPFLFFGFPVIDPARMGKPWPDSQHALASFARRATMDWKGRVIGPRELGITAKSFFDLVFRTAAGEGQYAASRLAGVAPWCKGRNRTPPDGRQ